MANPTTNFGWVMPTSTSLVTNLPADFNTFGQGVDTSMAQLKGGSTGQVLSKTSATDMAFTWVTPTDQTPLTTKGDLFTFSTVDARLAVGTNGLNLFADSTAATGLAWATPSGMTLINSGGTTLSGTTVTISSIPATYKHLFIVASNYYTNTADAETELRFNSDSGTNYTYNRIRNLSGTVAGVSALATTVIQLNTRSIATNTSGKLAASIVWVYNYTDTTPNKYVDYKSSALGSADAPQFLTGQANYKGTSAISSLSIINASTFSGGTIYVYGVN